MYRIIVWLHVVSAFLFMMSHGASAAVAFRLRHERDISRIQALLELTSSTARAMVLTLLLILISGIVAGVMGRWWLKGWFWTSLVLLILIAVFMGFFSGRTYYPLKHALGTPNPWGKPDSEQIVEEKPVDEQEVHRLVATSRPWEMAVISLIGWAIVVWLMLYKPF
jgi:F0F1-type ATP synthase assembly protein I